MQVPLDSHFEKREPIVRKIYDVIEKKVMKFGDVTVEPIKASIVFKKTGTFLALILRKDHMKVEFFLKEEYNAFPVEKTMRYTKSKVVHVVSVSSIRDVDKQLLMWMKESYELAK
ncbi:MAG TPA: DUF5655 domain-containing protein [Bacteroidia bacterium]|nr:DUF5655 domain-containing protein [Bacteroidia bacterium]